jgi:hypothetical protein
MQLSDPLATCFEPAMKTKIGVYLTKDVARRLKVVMRRHGATKSDIVNEALRQLFDPPPPVRDPSDEILQRVKAMETRLRHTQRNTVIISEMLGLFVRYYLTIALPVPKSEQETAKALGRERYKIFIQQVAKIIASDRGLLPDVIRAFVVTHPDLVASALAEARRQEAGSAGAHAAQAGAPTEGLSHA